MMNPISQTISPAERQVLRVIWAHPYTTSQFIIDSLQEAYHWQIPTIKTLINRLLKKEIISADKTNKQYKYYATISEEEQLLHESQELLSHVCNTKQKELLLQLLEQATLSQDDIQQLQVILQQKQHQAPQYVSCNCVKGQCSCNH